MLVQVSLVNLAQNGMGYLCPIGEMTVLVSLRALLEIPPLIDRIFGALVDFLVGCDENSI